MKEYYLKPIFDNCKSFYGKATVKASDDYNTLILWSYLTKVAEIADGQAKVIDTFSRHIKEFLKQNGFKAETKAQIKKDYMI